MVDVADEHTAEPYPPGFKERILPGVIPPQEMMETQLNEVDNPKIGANAGHGRGSYFDERVRANPYTGAYPIDRGLRSMREDMIDATQRPYTWQGALSSLAMALSGIQGGQLTPGINAARYGIEPGPMTLRHLGFETEPLTEALPRTGTALLGAHMRDVWPLPEQYVRALDEGKARRDAGQALAGRDFPERQFYELPFGAGLLPNPARLTLEDLKGIQPLMMTGYYTGLPGTLRSSLLEQIPERLKLLPKVFEGLGTSVERAPGELRTDAHAHP